MRLKWCAVLIGLRPPICSGICALLLPICRGNAGLARCAKFGIPPPPYVCDLRPHLCLKDTVRAQPRIFLATSSMPFSRHAMMLYRSSPQRVSRVRLTAEQLQRPDNIIYLSSNSSGDFTVAKEAPRSIKHLGKNPWSNFYIASTGSQCNFIKSNQRENKG